MTAMKMPVHMETVRLTLRPPHAEDAVAMFNNWAQDVEVTHYLTWRPHISLEQSQAAVARARMEGGNAVPIYDSVERERRSHRYD